MKSDGSPRRSVISEKAVALRPEHSDVRFNEGVARLLLGDLKRGLQA